MSRVRDLHKKWKDDPEYQQAYEELAAEFELMRAVVEARTKAGLTQEELASRMKTTQSVIARLEGKPGNATIKTLERIANATNTRLKISFENLP